MNPIKHFTHRKKMGISQQAEILLDIVYLEVDDWRTTVMQIIKQGRDMGIGGQATLHKALTSLKDANLITIIEKPADTREKRCRITEKGRKYLKGVLWD
jgi:DNA-binding MarR family transcriptional regulator